MEFLPTVLTLGIFIKVETRTVGPQIAAAVEMNGFEHGLRNGLGCFGTALLL